MLSGATGQLYGSAHTWRLDSAWEANLDTPGVMQLKYMRDLFVSRKWYALISTRTTRWLRPVIMVFHVCSGSSWPKSEVIGA